MLLNNDNDYNLLNKKSQPGAPVMSLIAQKGLIYPPKYRGIPCTKYIRKEDSEIL